MWYKYTQTQSVCVSLCVSCRGGRLVQQVQEDTFFPRASWWGGFCLQNTQTAQNKHTCHTHITPTGVRDTDPFQAGHCAWVYYSWTEMSQRTHCTGLTLMLIPSMQAFRFLLIATRCVCMCVCTHVCVINGLQWDQIKAEFIWINSKAWTCIHYLHTLLPGGTAAKTITAELLPPT